VVPEATQVLEVQVDQAEFIQVQFREDPVVPQATQVLVVQVEVTQVLVVRVVLLELIQA